MALYLTAEPRFFGFGGEFLADIWVMSLYPALEAGYGLGVLVVSVISVGISPPVLEPNLLAYFLGFLFWCGVYLLASWGVTSAQRKTQPISRPVSI